MRQENGKGKRKSNMVIPTIIMGVVAIMLFVIAYNKGDGQHIQGLKIAYKMTIDIIPLLVFSFVIAGLIQVLLPKELLQKWVGAESGVKGIIIGTIAGGLTPGGPYVSLPIIAGLLKAGASVGTMVAFITGWSLLAIARLPMEIGIIGWEFTCVRLVSTFTFPIFAGLIADVIYSWFVS